MILKFIRKLCHQYSRSSYAARNRKMHKSILLLIIMTLFALPSFASKGKNDLIEIAYIKIQGDEFAGVPSYLAAPKNEGISGAYSALADANKTGKFLGYQLSLEPIVLLESEQLQPAHQSIIQASNAIIIDSDPATFDSILQAVLALKPEALILNARNQSNALRSQYCNANLLHVTPNYQMKTDALGQWLRTKRIKNILMLIGPNVEDTLFADAFEQTIKQFKLKAVENKAWQFSFDLRRSAFEEIPTFTRSQDKYETVFVADHAQQFAYSLPFNTYYQVPVIGSAGLQALGWHASHEQWGARQLQGRFKEEFKRAMNQYDFYSYLAVTVVSTAVQAMEDRSGKNLYRYLLSDDASIAAYKGRKLTFANATRQLRQPLILAHEGALVTTAPMPGFLHQTNDLDTLGATVTGCEDN